jgi:membrane dipeptidase
MQPVREVQIRRIWDQHICLPLDGSIPATTLRRSRDAGAYYVSVNVGFAPHDAEAAMRSLTQFRSDLAAQPDDFLLVESASDLDAAAESGRLAVAFDLEDARPLDGDLGMVEAYYSLGVRTMLPTYNGRNEYGSGCLDPEDQGLTARGRSLVAEMNRVGMVVDGSHCSVRTSMDMIELSATPMIFSHSCCRAVWDHPRNVTDEQIKACAEAGGVVGICGVGIFVGPNEIGADAIVRHIDHAVQLVGPEHVGIGTDYAFDLEDLQRELEQSPHLFPEAYTRWGPIKFASPEDFSAVPAALRELGYPDGAVAAIVGGNFRRIAESTWKPIAG